MATDLQAVNTSTMANAPIYNFPCRYSFAPTGCPYGKTCPFQHANIPNRQKTDCLIDDNAETVTIPIAPVFDINLLGTPLITSSSSSYTNNASNVYMEQTYDTASRSNTFPIYSGSDNIYNIDIKESMETKWNVVPKTIPFGSRKGSQIDKFNKKNTQNTGNSELSLMVNNCAEDILNGLYVTSGYKNGYISYQQCNNNKNNNRHISIYCNPSRGWTISYNNTVYYYSYPLTPSPPTNDIWYNQGINTNDQLLPKIITKTQMNGHDLLDLLFIGFVRSEIYQKLNWFTVSADITNIFCAYFISHTIDRCSNCLIQCENVVLCGYKWLCQECKNEAMD